MDISPANPGSEAIPARVTVMGEGRWLGLKVVLFARRFFLAEAPPSGMTNDFLRLGAESAFACVFVVGGAGLIPTMRAFKLSIAQ